MKKNLAFCLMLPFFLAAISTLHAQGDIVTVKPQHNTDNPCGFILSIANHNTALKPIDEIKLEITSGNNITFQAFSPLPPHWTLANLTNTIADATSDNGGIAPGASLGGFVFAYDIQYNTPVTINWTTRSAGSDVSTGTIQPICTQYQSFNRLDTVTYITSQSGADPCFTFTIINKNQQGSSAPFSVSPIYHVAFQLQNVNGGTLRPSKITAPAGGDWVLDSVTVYTAYFHTDNAGLTQTNDSKGGFTICLRGNPTVTNYNFVWSVFDDQDAFIDQDTIFNIPNTATGSSPEPDILSASLNNGCLYNIALKNYHVSNPLPPSRIVKLILTSKTPGITFSAAPNAPPNWTKVITPSSIVYASPNDSDGIASGLISNQFSFSVTGPTKTNFDIGWETDRSASPATVSTGTLTQNCTVSAPATDTVAIGPGATTCNFTLNVKNTHNIKPQSALSMVSISIPVNSGQINPTTSIANWNTSTPTPTQINYQSPTGADDIQSNAATDFSFTFVPKNPGTNTTATWSTFDDDAIKSGTPVSTGSFTINCTPTVTICDTLTRTATLSNDSCTKTFTLLNRKAADILSLVLTVNNGWHIDSASTPVTGWTKQLDGSHSFVTYTSSAGFKSGQSQDFNIKFSGYFAQPVDTFTVTAVTMDRNGIACSSIDSELSCVSHIQHDYVQPHLDNVGVSNFVIQPNPTRGSADISFDINSAQKVVISVFDVLGHQTGIVTNTTMSQGTYHIPYIMSGLPDGTYYVRIQTPIGVLTKKLVLTK